MPNFLPQLAAVGVLAAGGSALAASVTGLGVAILGGLYQARRARIRERQAANLSQDGRTVTIRASDAPRTIVYGRARVSGPVAYHCVHGEHDEFYTYVVLLGGHEFDAIEDVLFNGESIGPLDPDTGYVQPGSKYWKSDIRQYPHEIPWHETPGAGGTITLPHNAIAIDSVAATTQDNTQLWALPGEFTWNQETPNKVTLNTSRFVGFPLVITYRYDAGRPLVRVKRFVGKPEGHRNEDLEADSGGVWTATDLWCGTPRLDITLENDREVFALGMPDVSAIVRGKKVRDWITGEVSWSNNWARCVADFLMDDYGYRAPLESIDETLMIVAQTVSDEDVPIHGGGTQKRYTIDGVLDSDVDRRENLTMMLASAAGMAAPSGGKWIVRAGAFVPPVMTLTDEDLAQGDVDLQPLEERRTLFNGVRGRFVDANGYYQPTDYPAYISATYVAQDGEEIVADVEFPLITNAERAQRVAKLLLHRSRLDMIWKQAFKLSAYPLQCGDTCYVQNTEYGFTQLNDGDGKLFALQERELLMDGRLILQLQEDAPEVYEWNYDEATLPDPAPNTALPDPRFVPQLANVKAYTDENTYERLSDGTVRAFIELTWDPVVDDGVLSNGHIEVAWKRANQVGYATLIVDPRATRTELWPVAADEVVNIIVRAVNGIGAKSDPVFITHRTDASLPGGIAQLPPSANYLPNATFAFGVGGWATSSGGNSDPITFAKASGNVAIAGIVSNAMLLQAGGNQSGLPQVQSTAIAVTPGKRYIGFASLQTFRCNGYVGIFFKDINGNPIGPTTASPIVTPGPALPAQEHYTQVHAIAVAPANAAYAVFCVFKTPTQLIATPTQQSWVLVHKPYFGEYADAVPMWSAGAVGSIGTGQLEANAATDLYRWAYSGNPFPISPVGDVYAHVLLTSDAVTPLVDATAVISTQTKVETTRINNNPDQLVTTRPNKGVTSTFLQVSVNGGGWQLVADSEALATRVDYDPIGTIRQGDAVLPDCRYAMTAGSTYRFRLVAAIQYQAESVISAAVIGLQLIKR